MRKKNSETRRPPEIGELENASYQLARLLLFLGDFSWPSLAYRPSKFDISRSAFFCSGAECGK
jgi:hypothetical protein